MDSRVALGDTVRGPQGQGSGDHINYDVPSLLSQLLTFLFGMMTTLRLVSQWCPVTSNLLYCGIVYHEPCKAITMAPGPAWFGPVSAAGSAPEALAPLLSSPAPYPQTLSDSLGVV